MGFSWGAFEKIAELVAPIVLSAAGVPAPLVPLVVHGIQLAESAGNGAVKSGADKKAIAMDAILTGLNGVNTAKPGTVDVGQLTAVISSGIDDTVAAVNAAKNIPVHPNQLQ